MRRSELVGQTPLHPQTRVLLVRQSRLWKPSVLAFGFYLLLAALSLKPQSRLPMRNRLALPCNGNARPTLQLLQ
eukprot:5069971-Amphidinium_carterae.1